MSATQWLNVFRRNSGNELYYGVLTLDSAGDVGTENPVAALSDFYNTAAPVAIRVIPGSATNLVIASARTSGTSAEHLQWREFALSGYSLTGQAAVQAQATPGSAASDNRGFGMEIFGADYGMITCFADGGTLGAYPFRFTATQSIGSLVDSNLGNIASQDQAGQATWKSQTTSNVAYSSTSKISKWTLSEGSPPSLAVAVSHTADLGAWNYGFSSTLSNRGLIVPPPTEEAGGMTAWITNTGFGHWLGEGTTMIMGATASHNGNNLGGYGDATTKNFNRHNIDYVHIDTSGDWVRGVIIAGYPQTGTTGLAAIPVNLNPKEGRVKVGNVSLTTNLTPHDAAPCNFGAAYHADWTTSQILIACEDTAAAPSYISLPITI
jgi:hypothetical protein